MRAADAVTDRHRPRSVPRAFGAVAILVVGILVAGCGGGARSPGIANITTTTTTGAHSSSPSDHGGGGGGPALSGRSSPSNGTGSARNSFAMAPGNPQSALKFSECMRANGEPDFPDPNGQDVIQGSGIDPASSAFQKAQKACAKDLGPGRAPSPAQQARAQADALAYSRCMRSHGVPDFPDPTFGPGGGIAISSLRGHSGSDLDPHSPIYAAAQKTCQPLMAAGLPGAKAAS